MSLAELDLRLKIRPGGIRKSNWHERLQKLVIFMPFYIEYSIDKQRVDAAIDNFKPKGWVVDTLISDIPASNCVSPHKPVYPYNIHVGEQSKSEFTHWSYERQNRYYFGVAGQTVFAKKMESLTEYYQRLENIRTGDPFISISLLCRGNGYSSEETRKLYFGNIGMLEGRLSVLANTIDIRRIRHPYPQQ